MEAATCLAEKHVAHPKTPRALNKFEDYLAKMQAEKGDQDAKRMDRVAKFVSETLSDFKANRAVVESEHGFKSTMEFAHERAKQGHDLETTILALDSDEKAHTKYYLALKMHKRLLKVD